jgi:hypothetical protein
MSKKKNEQPVDQDAVETVVQPVAAGPELGPEVAASSDASEPPAPPAPPTYAAPAAPQAPRRSRWAWVSSPKVAAATVITAIALGGLGGAFALGRATAGPDHHERILIGEVGFERAPQGGPFQGGPGFNGWDR